MIQVNTNEATTKDFETIDLIVDLETKRKISKVKGAEDYGIMTACFIDGSFVCVSDHEITEEMRTRLEKA